MTRPGDGRKALSALAMLGLAVFIGAVLALAAVTAGRLGLGGKAYERWMLAWFVGAVLVGVAGLLRVGLTISRKATARAEDEARREREDGIRRGEERFQKAQEELRRRLRQDPELAPYANLVGEDHSLRSVEGARERDARVRQLRSDPRTAKYAERVFRGEPITDAMIRYWEDPSQPLLCEHLRQMEADLRAADPKLTPQQERVVKTHLNLKFERLRQRYNLPADIVFEEEELSMGRAADYYQGEQSVRCPRCGCVVMGTAYGAEFPPP